MKQIIIREIVRPMVTRVGSTLAGALIAFASVNTDTSVSLDQLTTALTVLLLFASDLVGSWWARRQ